MSAVIHVGDARDVLKTLPGKSVQCCVTSPPYYGLRDYGTGEWEGGDATCQHLPSIDIKQAAARSSTLGPHKDGRGVTATQEEAERSRRQYRHTCPRCGAVRVDRQLGLEATVDEYIANMVDVFRGVWRVLRDDGTCWLNIGDSYAGSGKGPTGVNGVGNHETRQGFSSRATRPAGQSTGGTQTVDVSLGGRGVTGYKPKSLMMIPARLALALADDGWIIRSDICWAKTAPMPESVTDRPTSAWEHIFLLTKHPRYWYDSEAVREKSVSEHPSGNGYKRPARLSYADANGARGNDEQWQPTAGRNLWSYWLLSPESFPGAHFATFPTEIPRRAILAGTSERGACPACGAGWVRVVERFSAEGDRRIEGAGQRASGPMARPGKNGVSHSQFEKVRMGDVLEVSTTGWQPSCKCLSTAYPDWSLAGTGVEAFIVEHAPEFTPVPCTVLDPFAGAGTTLLVADRLGRHGIGIELSAEYARMAEARIKDDAGMFADVTHETGDYQQAALIA